MILFHIYSVIANNRKERDNLITPSVIPTSYLSFLRKQKSIKFQKPATWISKLQTRNFHNLLLKIKSIKIITVIIIIATGLNPKYPTEIALRLNLII